jgi:tetratricopeptide (TPR) repeat protein
MGFAGLWLASALAVQTAPQKIRAGAAVESEIADGAPAVGSPVLSRPSHTAVAPVGRTFELEGVGTGPVTLELRSLFFDGYLVLRDEMGAVVAEDDDGWYGTNPRIVVERLEPGHVWRVDACALHGRRGPFTLRLTEGKAAPLAKEERHRLALADARAAVVARTEVDGDDAASVADALVDVARLLVEERRHDEARPLVERAATTLERTFDVEDESTAASLEALGEALVGHGLFDRGERFLRRSLEIRQKLLGTLHDVAVTTLVKLAVTLFFEGKGDESVRLLEQACAVAESKLGPDHATTGVLLSNLGDLRRMQGQDEQALPCLERAVVIAEREHGLADEQTVRTSQTLALVLLDLGHAAEAKARYEQLRPIAEKVLPPDDLMLAGIWNNLGVIYESEGRVEEARVLVARAVEQNERLYGAVAGDTETSEEVLARILLELGRPLEARRVFERSVALAEEALGPDSDWTIRRAVALARLVRSSGDDAAAEPLFERVVQSFARAKVENGESRRVRLELADVRRSLHQYADAKGDYTAALRGAPDASSPLELLLFRHRFADTLRNLNELDAARLEEQSAIDQLGPRVAADDPALVAARESLAVTLRMLGQLPGARDLFESVLAVREKSLPANHPDLQATRRNLAGTLRQLGDTERAAWVEAKVVESRSYPPTLVLVEPASPKVELDTRSATLRLVATDVAGLDDVLVVDGAASTSLAARPDVLHRDQNGRDATVEYPVRIREPSLQTLVTFVAIGHDGQRSEPKTVEVRYAPPKRNLFVLAVGVAHFADATLDLRSSVKDVESLCGCLRGQEGQLYGKVSVHTLVDREVTTAALRRELDQFLLQATSDDAIVVFVAGHAVRTPQGEYFFLTSDATPKDPYAGVDWRTLEDLVTAKRLHARKKVLLLDTCCSGLGAADERGDRGAGAVAAPIAQEDVDRLVDDERGGTYVVGATSRDRPAIEGAENGVFTAAVVAALGGAADLPPNGNGDGYVQIAELSRFVADEVVRRTGGRQEPTAPRTIGGENFRIAKVARADAAKRPVGELTPLEKERLARHRGSERTVAYADDGYVLGSADLEEIATNADLYFRDARLSERKDSSGRKELVVGAIRASSSLAKSYGLESGDVVVSINDVAVESKAQVYDWLRSSSKLAKYVFVLRRGSNEVTKTLLVPRD